MLPTITTSYTLVATDDMGCTSETAVVVFVNNCSAPDPCFTFSNTASPNQTICSGEVANLSVLGGTSWLWTPSNTLTNPTSQFPTASPSTTTTYTVQSTDSNGCTATDQVTITVENSVSVFAGNDITICEGTPSQLQASGASNFQWSPIVGLSNPTIANPIVSPASNTTYTVMTTSNNGCTYTDEVNVFVDGNLAGSAGNDQTICRGSSTSLQASGGSLYQWSPAEGLTTTNTAAPLATPLTTTTYCVTITSAEGCTVTDCVTINVLDYLDAVACEDKSISQGETANLTVTTGASYQWSPQESLTDSRVPNPTAFPTTTTVYTVTVTSDNGCTSTDQVAIFVTEPKSSNRIALRASVFLQGAMEENSTKMQDNLREFGFIPLTEPYTDLLPYPDSEPCFEHKGSGGKEITTLEVLEKIGDDAIVDWVFLELHDAKEPTNVVATRSALLQRDGDIVDVDGTSPVVFQMKDGSYFLAVRHRNHLGAMTATPLDFSDNQITSFDFTDVEQPIYKLKESNLASDFPMKKMNGVNCLWGGNSNADRKIIFQGPDLDQDKLFYDIFTNNTNISANNGLPNLNYIINDYCLGDNNMDGFLKYQGQNNDIDNLQFFNVILHSENERFIPNKIIYEQIPK